MIDSAKDSVTLAAGPAAGPAVVTEDPDLLDRLLRLCAAAGVTPDLAADTSSRRRAWSRAGLVLVGSDQAAEVAGLDLGRRDQVVVLSGDVETADLWQLAIELGATQVLRLPPDEHRLIGLLSDLADGRAEAMTVGVIGAVGGAGASTVAAGLALTATKAGRRALLIDADPLGGGIQLLLGCEDAPGLRWPDLAATQGRVGASAFRSALPSVASLPVVSWDSTGPRQVVPGVMRGLLGAAQRGAELVVVDLPRHLDDVGSEAIGQCAVVLLVVPSRVRGVAAARSMLDGLRATCGDLRVVVRLVPHSNLPPDTVADALDQSLSGVVRTHRSLARAVDDGLGPLGRGGLERSCRSILGTLADRG